MDEPRLSGLKIYKRFTTRRTSNSDRADTESHSCDRLRLLSGGATDPRGDFLAMQTVQGQLSHEVGSVSFPTQLQVTYYTMHMPDLKTSISSCHRRKTAQDATAMRAWIVRLPPLVRCCQTGIRLAIVLPMRLKCWQPQLCRRTSLAPVDQRASATHPPLFYGNYVTLFLAIFTAYRRLIAHCVTLRQDRCRA